MRKVQSGQGAHVVRDVLNYTLDGINANNKQVLIEAAKMHLTKELEDDVMTLVQQFKQEGRQTGR